MIPHIQPLIGDEVSDRDKKKINISRKAFYTKLYELSQNL